VLSVFRKKQNRSGVTYSCLYYIYNVFSVRLDIWLYREALIMSGELGDLSPKQAATLQEFKEELCDVIKPHHDDHYLLRWLRARDFDLKKSADMLRSNLKWREELGVDRIFEDFNPPEVCRIYYTGGVMGADKEGCPIWWDPYGCIDLKGICYSSKKSDIIKYKVRCVEQCYRKMAEQSQKLGKKIDKLLIVFDLEKLGIQHLWRPGLEIFNGVLEIFESRYPETTKNIILFNGIELAQALFVILEDFYPETLKYCLICNAPRIFPVIYNLVKPFLSENSRKRIRILGSNYQEELQKLIDKSEIPQCWGGTKVGPEGDPRCSHEILWGGKVPESYYSQVNVNTTMENMTKVQIGRGSTCSIEIKVTAPKTILRWCFQTEGNDIGFGVFYKTDPDQRKVSQMQTVLTSTRVNCHMVPEDGNVECTQTGIYVFRFDNSYSYLKSKKVHYSLELIPPETLSDCSDLSFQSAEDIAALVS
ncbi:unnamed protein product, partial [Owenia fusiformis]